MSETINIEIKADQSGADEALKQVNKSLKEGTEAAEALNHVLDGDLAGAFKSLGELSKTLGGELGLAFSPAEIIAFVQIIAEVTDKVSKLIADTFIYTDGQKALDAEIRSSNQVIAGYAAQIAQLDEAYAKMGKTASQQTAMDIGKLQAQLNAANDEVDRLTREIEAAQDIAADPNKINAIGNAMALPGLKNELGKAQQAQRVLFDEMRNLTATFHSQQDAELTAIAEAEISGRLRVQEASVNAEKAKWDRIRELTHTSADQNMAVEIGFENRLYQVKREALRERLELMKLDPDHNAVAITTLSREIEALAKEHEAALTRIKTEGDKERHRVEEQQSTTLAKQTSDTLAQAKAENDAIIKAADEQFQVWDEGYKGQIEVAKIASETKIQLITQQFEKGKITQQQEIALIAKAKQDELALEIYYQQQRQALWDKDPKKVQEIQNQINKIKAQSELIGVKATTDELKAADQKWKSFTSSISQSLNSALSGWIQGTQTFGQAWAKMADDMAMKFISSLEQQLVQFLVHLAVKDAADKAASAKNNLRAAYDSAHNTYKWASGTVGPVIAGVLAAGAFVAAESLGSAEGGQYYVPNNQLTMLHPQEMVLPAGIANQMRSVIGGGGSGGSGVTVVVNHSVSAVDAASFQGHIRRHSNMIANEVTRALKRKGAR